MKYRIDKAKPDGAIETLKKFENFEKDIDGLMFIKHPHVVDSMRRLRRYVGNISDWDMSGAELESFSVKAEEIRSIAENIFEKMTKIMKIENADQFWDSFMEKATAFRNKCKSLTEDEVLLLCADPDSREAFLHRIDLEEISKADKKPKKDST